MQIREISDKNTWERFLAEQKQKSFMQSWYWGEFHERMGQKIWRLGAYADDVLRGVCLVSKVKARRGTFFEIEHGPVATEEREQVVAVILERLKVTARQEGAGFIRISPVWERSKENRRMFGKLGFRQAPTYAAAESSWKLHIGPAEEELLAAMRKTTRYLIRQTSKNSDIEIVQSTKREDLEVFDAVNKEVAKRQRFVPFSQRYREAEFDAFVKDDRVVLFLGKYQGKVIAAALVIFWSGIGVYHQAASLGEYAKYSLPYLVQWEAIKEAKRRGCTLYDFWGFVDPKKYPKHPWAGPTLFKMGFGGKAYEYVKTQDYPLSWKYWPIAIFEMVRTKRRGL